MFCIVCDDYCLFIGWRQHCTTSDVSSHLFPLSPLVYRLCAKLQQWSRDWKEIFQESCSLKANPTGWSSTCPVEKVLVSLNPIKRPTGELFIRKTTSAAPRQLSLGGKLAAEKQKGRFVYKIKRKNNIWDISSTVVEKCFRCFEYLLPNDLLL